MKTPTDSFANIYQNASPCAAYHNKNAIRSHGESMTGLGYVSITIPHPWSFTTSPLMHFKVETKRNLHNKKQTLIISIFI